MNFATLRSLAIPEGNVTQITIGGVTVWVSSKPIKLQVKKITSDTYAGETTYTGEQFILLDIYPKSADSVVKVTYGGITKTLTFSGTNSMPVQFGTFNGVSDSVSTPESGVLTISGDYNGFSTGSFQTGSKDYDIGRCGCITAVDDLGDIREFTNVSFCGCTELNRISFPSGITSIGSSAFSGCTGLTLSSLPETVTNIGASAFNGCTGITLSSLPSKLTEIMDGTFEDCTGLTLSSLPKNITKIGTYAFDGCTGITLSSLPSKLNTVGTSAFNNCTGLTLSALPSTLLYIGAGAFSGCTNITLTSLPNVKSLENSVFEDCYNINITSLPSSVTRMGNKVFKMESSSASKMNNGTITLPANLDNVGDTILARGYGTSYCVMPNVIIMQATTPPRFLGSYPIFGSWRSEAKIIVPAGCSAAYKAADGWSNYANYIVEG